MSQTQRRAKQDVSELAIFGGKPSFERPLHVGQPNIGDRDRLHGLLDEILDRRWLTNHGPLVTELESKLARLMGVRHCIAVCNGTVALEIAIRALGLKGEVIVPSFTFAATAHALQWQEITPIFCDVDPRTHTLDPERVERMVSSRTTGILGVHLWGRACDVEGLSEVARRHRLALLFDAAHAFAVSRRGRMIGNFGDCEVFSFHATKVFNTFEGGAIATNDDQLARRLRWMQNFGFSGYDQVDHIGVNGKMSEISAAMGLVGLESLDEFIGCNRRNHARYAELLAGIPGLQLHGYDPAERQNHQYVVVEVDQDAAGIGRDALVELLHAENVLVRRYFYPGVHRMEPYRSLYPNAGLLLPVTERLVTRTMILPTGTGLSVEDVDGVCDLIRLAVGQGAEILARKARAQGPRGTAAASARPPPRLAEAAR
ncbi:aminotransferase class I/II-fold pyridoxal phosphate-dependent enzyme [Anaeromyxobacter paludicola]|uniref:dTDP-4-dehydro-6-deoxyglucose aminotransferase n=1 Tax=Anaeromyxobacter paludicola TaxID=2918171 RepID=A0ABN6N202_9BACT|nr:aminotransferase class I/II-fold pyridoxal phosphate-dependent enzyme [Anaeromyxobacter paludicola]BDG07086.1 dTDP-4-dehydro-6-deoxyglucose aminotransferase [Anaeromyxobacter paludicola]